MMDDLGTRESPNAKGGLVYLGRGAMIDKLGEITDVAWRCRCNGANNAPA